MTDISSLPGLIKDLGATFEDFKARNDLRVQNLENVLGRGGMGGGLSTLNDGETKKEFSAFLRSGRPSSLMESSNDPAGGFTIPMELNKQILETAKEQVTLRKLARVVTGGPDYRQVVCTKGPAYGWATEKSTRAATDTPELAAINFIFGELFANAGIYNHLLEDSFFDLAAWLIEKINESFAVGENQVFLTGNAVGKPKGICSYDFTDETDADRPWGKLQYVASGSVDSLAAADKLIQLVYTLRPGYHKGAAWIMHPTTAEIVRKMKDGEGRWIWSYGLAEGQPATLLGYPVHIDEQMPIIEADALALLFGNFQGYTVVDHPRGMTIIRDNVTTKGLTSFYVSRRLAGAMTDFHSVKALKIAVS